MRIDVLEAWLAEQAIPMTGRSVDEVRALLTRGNPYHDKTGKFSSAHGVRGSLASAGTTAEIGAAAADEAKAITGRDIDFDFTGSDEQVAREHAEGVLRGLEKFPHAPLSEVGMFHGHADKYAVIEGGRGKLTPLPNKRKVQISGDRILFNSFYASPAGSHNYHEALKNDVAAGWHPPGTGSPIHVASHEFGHVVGHVGLGNPMGQQAAGKHLAKVAKSEGVHPSEVASRISGYAKTNHSELAAEAYADVAARGSSANALSKDIADAMTGNYNSWVAAVS